MKVITPIATGAKVRGNENDCVVRAIANSFNMPYDEAHRLARKHGRRDNRGMPIGMLSSLLREVGAECIGVFGTTIAAGSFGRLFPETTKYRGVTVERAIKMCGTGSYMFHVRGHIFAVVDGEIVDNAPIPANCYVTAIFGVKDN